jgi:hypothetical protein
MIQRDYILRLIADFAEFLARLLNLRKEELPAAYDEAVAKMEQLYGMSFAEFLAMDNEQLLRSDWPVSGQLADSLADIFQQMAIMATQVEQYAHRAALLQKALYLYMQAESKDRSFKFERIVAINQIKEQLGVE